VHKSHPVHFSCVICRGLFQILFSPYPMTEKKQELLGFHGLVNCCNRPGWHKHFTVFYKILWYNQLYDIWPTQMNNFTHPIKYTSDKCTTQTVPRILR